MAVLITGVEPGSPAHRVGVRRGELLQSINGNLIRDVLDYRFYMLEERLELRLEGKDGIVRTVRVRKEEYDDLGLEFETYLMDRQHHCKNKCIFCFVDQMPGGLRESLYFKDDDSRMSFLFGSYVTLTNVTEEEIQRIIKMHISPINVSVHTSGPGAAGEDAEKSPGGRFPPLSAHAHRSRHSGQRPAGALSRHQ